MEFVILMMVLQIGSRSRALPALTFQPALILVADTQHQQDYEGFSGVSQKGIRDDSIHWN
ncbi:hypothetical protein ID866_3133 [Astraeus odoratus]|nr:hypothetical protein ID866_3133 [Astraeus odoratus]